MRQQSGSAQRDRYDRKTEDHQVRFAAGAADDLVETARGRGWQRIAIAGDPRLTRDLAEELGRPDLCLELVQVEGAFEWQRPAQLAEALAPALADAQRTRLRELALEALDRAAAGGRGAAGPAEVAAALAEGRVHILLLEAGRELAGVAAPDGRPAPLGTVPEGAAPEELVPVPRLEERLAALALGTSAQAVMVPGDAVPELAEAGGAAAILRW
jgi:hypothetical protein